ncbi:MAG: IS1595 family transposase [Dehalococcoidia bacterium]|nr:IS1595 family transposase [Dehalococcoidia bacterium]
MPPVNRKNPVRAKSSESEYTLFEFMREYPDDDACLETLWRRRYSPDGEHAHCPRCDAERVFKRYETKQQRQSWSCTSCAHKLHPTAGTIFHKSSTSLHLWFYAMYLMTSTRCGISAKQLERELGVTYKTAWRMAHLIRNELMEQDDIPLGGDVEVEETFVGGKLRFKGRQGYTGPVPGSNAMANKTTVAGAVARGGRVMAVTVPNRKKATLLGHVERRVLPSATVYTDEHAAYDDLPKRGYAHQRINHSEHVYVSGTAHTNTIEGFWSLVKRGIGGVYHSVSAKHLQGYLNEYAWRYNLRNTPSGRFDLLLWRAVLR